MKIKIKGKKKLTQQKLIKKYFVCLQGKKNKFIILLLLVLFSATIFSMVETCWRECNLKNVSSKLITKRLY